MTQYSYSYTRKNKFSKDFSLCDQIRRASVSVMSNIAEGFESQSNSEFIKFLFYAKRSSGEVRCQLYIAKDQGHIFEEKFKIAYEQTIYISKLISKFITYLKNIKTF
ncbi:MAG: four helix bundle protein [Parcubacteria group bacterium CG23_combo_of_CG06-09_8_20_14_all_35_9]|nr:MAG: four helix bundle protein [Parcubacteria group bacterium CG23_combo_of_CG06-09_8_20_14_all_35_9]